MKARSSFLCFIAGHPSMSYMAASTPFRRSRLCCSVLRVPVRPKCGAAPAVPQVTGRGATAQPRSAVGRRLLGGAVGASTTGDRAAGKVARDSGETALLLGAETNAKAAVAVLLAGRLTAQTAPPQLPPGSLKQHLRASRGRPRWPVLLLVRRLA
jgi:hypothetical protein